MDELGPEIAAEVAQVCAAGAEEAASSLSRAFDTEIKASVGDPDTVRIEAPPGEWAGPGLAVVLSIGDSGAAFIVPETAGILPPWYGEPDRTGRSKLTTLAQELAMVLLPERFEADRFEAGKVDDLAAALAGAGMAEEAAWVPLVLEFEGERDATGYLVWPIERPLSLVEGKPPTVEAATPPSSAPSPAATPSSGSTVPPLSIPGARVSAGEPLARGSGIPPLTKSLLKISLPVVVTLASQRQPLGRIVRLAPGSIIPFEKSCEQMLELSVGDRPIAKGEAVKVGEKFGLRINAMVLPEERFSAVRKRPAG